MRHRPVDVVAVLWAGPARGSAGEHNSFMTRGPEMVDKLLRGVVRYIPNATSFTLMTNHPAYDELQGATGLRGALAPMLTVRGLEQADVARGWWSKAFNMLRNDIPMETRRRLYIDLDNVLGPQSLTPLTDLPLSCDVEGAPVAYMPDDRVVAGHPNGSAVLFDVMHPNVEAMREQARTNAAAIIADNPAYGCRGARGAGGDQPWLNDGFGRVGLMQNYLPAGLISHAKLDLAANPNGDFSHVGMMVGWWNIDPIERPDLPYYKEQWV